MQIWKEICWFALCCIKQEKATVSQLWKINFMCWCYLKNVHFIFVLRIKKACEVLGQVSHNLSTIPVSRHGSQNHWLRDGMGAVLTQTVRWFVAAVSFPVKAIAGVTRADNSSKVVSALLLAGRCITHVHTYRDREKRKSVRELSMLKLFRIKNITVITCNCFFIATSLHSESSTSTWKLTNTVSSVLWWRDILMCQV